MGKGERNRRLRRRVFAEWPTLNQRSVARALRRRGRMPLLKRKGQL